MAVINLSQGKGGGGGDFKLLEADVYRAKIASATLEEDQFADTKAGEAKPLRLVLRWEVTEAGEDQDDDVVGCAVWQRYNPYYGTVREGGPSKFKAFIDALREQGYLDGFDPSIFDTDTLTGIEQRISVEKYIKTMGANVGKPGNKVGAVLPLKRKKASNALQGITAEKARSREGRQEPTTPRNVPQQVTAGVEEADIPDF